MQRDGQTKTKILKENHSLKQCQELLEANKKQFLLESLAKDSNKSRRNKKDLRCLTLNNN